MSVDTVTGSESPSYSSNVSGDSYGNVDVSQTDGGDIASHIEAIKGFTSQKEIQDYINKNIIQFFKSQSPPNLSAIDRTINDLIVSLAGDDEKLAAVVYHAADAMPNNNLTIENTDLEGKRKIVLGSSVKAISDSFYDEILIASQDIQAYTNNYFNTSPSDSSTSDSSNSDRSTSDSSNSDSSTSDSSTKDTSKFSFSDEIISFLPDDTTLDDLNETLIIDTKTGKEIDPRDYNKNDPKEVAELEKIMETAVTIQTDGHHEGLADDDNSKKIADALVQYITRPYEGSVSEDGLHDILDNLSLEMSGYIFKNVQDTILSSANPADIIKLTNFKNKINDNGLDGIIAEVYNYNYLGGNTNDPSLFLTDIFKNDPSQKLNTVNIEQISTVLSEQLNDFLSDTNDPPDKKPLDFISQALSALSTSNPENLASGNIEELLKKIADKTKRGKPQEVKDILSDLATNSGIDTVKTATTQTGQTLISNFGEFTYTNDKGKSTTFSSDDISGSGFNQFTNDIIQLIQGGGTLVTPPADEPTKAVLASQAADMITALSPAQQQVIIQKLINANIDTNLLEHFIPLASDISTNLSNIVQQIDLADDIKDLNAATTVEAKASTFADIISTFDDPTSSTELDNLIHALMQNQTTEPKSFLGLDVNELAKFNSLLREELQNKGIGTTTTDSSSTDTSTTIDTIIKNLGISLSKESITFDSNGKKVYAETVLENGADTYLDTLKTGTGLSVDNAKLFLDSLTPEQKSDPNYFVNILKDNDSFATIDEFEKFITSIHNILAALAEKNDPEFDTLKTNITNALLNSKPKVDNLDFTNKDNLKIGNYGIGTTDGSYLAFLSLADNNWKDGVKDDFSNVVNALDLKVITANTDYVNHIVQNLDEETSQGIIDKIKTGLSNDATSLATFNTNITNAKTDKKKAENLSQGISTAQTYDEALANFKALGDTITAENFDQFQKELVALMKFSNLLSVSNTGNGNSSDQKTITKKILEDIGITANTKDNDASSKQAALLELFANASVSYVLDTKKDPNNGLKDVKEYELLRQITDSAADSLDNDGEQGKIFAHRIGYALYRLDSETYKKFIDGSTVKNADYFVSGESFHKDKNKLKSGDDSRHEDQAMSGLAGNEYVSKFGSNLNVIEKYKKESTTSTTPETTTVTTTGTTTGITTGAITSTTTSTTPETTAITEAGTPKTEDNSSEEDDFYEDLSGSS